jgi:hypothetical protein
MSAFVQSASSITLAGTMLTISQRRQGAWAEASLYILINACLRQFKRRRHGAVTTTLEPP